MTECHNNENDAGVIRTDSKYTIENANEIALDMFQAVKGLIGRKISEVIPEIFLHSRIYKPYSQIVNINEREIFITSFLLDDKNRNFSMIIILQELDKMPEMFKNFKKNNEMDFLLKVMENDVSITDGKGIFLKIGNTYEQNYGVKKDEIINKSAFELEKKGIFYPSVTAMVLKEKKKMTILQKNKLGRNILTTAVPVFDKNKEIEYVVSFDTIDMADLGSLQEKYEKLIELMERYSTEIKELRLKEMQFPGIISKSQKMKKVFRLILNIAEADVNILITGETGVGKNLIAKQIHQQSLRSSAPFIEINCGTIPETLIESELFGYEQGSFTGAHHRGKIGQIELAHGGTLFLDEIGELPLNMQTKLLTAIQEKKICKIGSSKYIKVDFRLIVATNKDLKKLVNEGLFRQDLFYRLNVVPIHIPGLRERPEDIFPLAIHFLSEFNRKYNKRKILSQQVIDGLVKYHWPGNIRELENLIERCVLTVEEDEISMNNVPDNIILTPFKYNDRGFILREALELYEKQLVQSAYERHKTTIEVGKALGISQPTAVRKLKKYIPNYSE